MKLTYRGVSYEYNPPVVEVSDSDSVGKYRGLDVRFRNPKKVTAVQTTLDLKYRNVTYHPAQPAIAAPAVQPEAAPVAAVAAPIAAEPVVAPALSVQDKARTLMMGHDRLIKRRQQSMLTRLDAEVGMDTQEASRYWNRIQGKVHPSFRSTYDRSAAALS